MKFQGIARIFAVAALSLGVIVAELHSDWLGECIEGTTISAKEEIQTQKCSREQDCDPNETGACAFHLNKLCKDQGDLAPWGDLRTIRYGECDSAANSDKCYICQNPKTLICSVWYQYKSMENNVCLNRCPFPEAKWVTAADRCKP